MVKWFILAFSLVLMASAMPSHAEGPGDVLQGIGRAMNGEPPRDYRWRERAYWHERHRLNEGQRELDARRRALHYERRFNEENGFYGR